MLKFMTSADVAPETFSDWYIFNTWLQRQTGQSIHLDIPVSVSELHDRIDADSVDIIYASPYDAGMLVREKGFVPLSRPNGLNDEIVVVVSQESEIPNLASIPANVRVALTEDRDVKLIGMILVEPSDLNDDNMQLIEVESGVIVAKKVMKDEAELGFVLARTYDQFSNLIQKSLRVLVRSQIDTIHHCLMVKPEVLDSIPELPEILVDMHANASSKTMLENLGMTKWTFTPIEDIEFMIDLMETMR